VGVKLPACEADHLPRSSAEVVECVALYLHSTNTPLWRGGQLKKHRLCNVPVLLRRCIEHNSKDSGSSVSVLIRLWTVRPGFDSRRCWDFFFSPRHRVRTGSVIYLISYRGVKLSCEPYYSPLSSAEVRNAWSYTYTSQYVFMA